MQGMMIVSVGSCNETAMTRIVVDAALREKLHNLTEPLELCDEAGHVLARVTPVFDPALYGPLEPQISEEELRRREQSDRWYTSAEVLAHLTRLEEQQ
jgi:hypothetical protein